MTVTENSLASRAYIVTGAAGDIGAATVATLLGAGARVCAFDRSDEALDRMRSRLPAVTELLTVSGDVTQEASVAGMVAAAHRRFGRLDGIVNNAGIEGVRQPIDRYPREIFDAVLAVNVTGTFLGMKHAAPLLRAAGRGAIVNLSSTAGIKGAENASAYVASKHAVIGLTRCAAIEYGPHGLRVNCVCPGPIHGRMIDSLQADPETGSPLALREQRKAQVPARRYGTPAEVANVVAFLLSDAASFVNGACYSIDGGISAI